MRIDPQKIINRLMPCAQPDKSGFLADDNSSLLIQCLHWNTTRSKLEPVPLQHAESGIHAASWARLDNREELGKKLDIAPAELAGICETELILYSYLKWGESCVDHLIGDFVFVILDRKENKVFCGRDHMGVKPLYYYASDDLFVCATNVSALRQEEGMPFEIDERWIAEYLLQLSMSFDRTPYQGIMKLPPAHSLTVTPQTARLRQYFTLSAEPELKLAKSSDYVDAYREVLEEAIRCRLDSDYAIGSELSGGIDSSTVTAFAAKFIKEPDKRLHTFGSTLFELEKQLIMEVCREARVANNHIFTTLATDSNVSRQRSMALLGYPVEHGMSTAHEIIYQHGEQLGIRTLLSGFGGDEFCTTIHGYMVPMALAVESRYLELFRILPGNPFFRFLRLLKMEWRRRKAANFTTSAPLGFLDEYKARWPHRIVREELADKYSLKERFFDAARFDEGYTDLKKFTLEKRWQPFVPTRMENCTLMASGRRIEYRWPLLDIRLVSLFLSIPAKENYYRGMGRYLHRRAIDGVVPGSVTWKQSKDMGALASEQPWDNHLLLDVDVAGLHPTLTACMDAERLLQQVERFQMLMKNTVDDEVFQIRKNMRAVKELNDWLYQLQTSGFFSW